MSAPFSPLDPADGAELLEPFSTPSTFFSGVKVYIVHGAAHLLFYSEQPHVDGRAEFIVVARMVAPAPIAAAAFERIASAARQGEPVMSHIPDGVLAN